MIKSFKHKGLEKYYETGSKQGIQAQHISKLTRILDRLDASISPKDMQMPGYRLHKPAGKETGTWAVWVSGNWRVTFEFDGENAVRVDYIDYH
ncbi:MAG: type II toxin-antitoxin system RelE/ParE family toxin [Spirochaetales bacterium]|nr:type II toxin-antitoxin system RelE/ParE family toxin [Spirochaetales bacterium]